MTVHLILFSTFSVIPLTYVCLELCYLISRYLVFSRYRIVIDFYFNSIVAREHTVSFQTFKFLRLSIILVRDCVLHIVDILTFISLLHVPGYALSW